MENKVLAFPREKIVREIPEVIEDRMERYREISQYKYAEAVTQELVLNLWENIEEFEIDQEDEAFIRDFHVVSDMLRALVYRANDCDHHLHSFIDKTVIVKHVEDITQAEIETVQEEMEIINEKE